MNYAPLTPFEFSRDGHSNRRDADAEPRVLLIGIDEACKCIHIHYSGDTHIRAVPTLEAAKDDDLVAGMTPGHALRIGVEWQRIVSECEWSPGESRPQEPSGVLDG